MKKNKIKIGHQDQANKPIFLLPNGVIECGNFRYRGRYIKLFKAKYENILCLAYGKPQHGVIDVSQYGPWDAIRIFYDHVVAKWLSSVSADEIELFARETEVFNCLEDIREEFKRAVRLRWQREFRNADLNDPNAPRESWQIL